MFFYGRCEEEEEGDEEEIRFTPQVSRVSNNLWSDILWNATNGKVSRDYLTGTYYQQKFWAIYLNYLVDISIENGFFNIRF